ncbi:MAG: sulfatase-like hydrolase/transferase [Solirubrobacteraceae bacterium]
MPVGDVDQRTSLSRSTIGYTQNGPAKHLYLHSHDTGRYVQPYGHQVPTPNVQRLADQGLLFRQAFCAAPTCSGSRACLLTGQWAHVNGMTGLAHRGWKLVDYGRHVIHPLRAAGYWSALIGEQHISSDPSVLGYDHVVDVGTSRVHSIAPAALQLLRSRPPQPFFLSIGFFETHREFFEPSSVRDALYGAPPTQLPDTAATRADMAAFKASARSLDQGVGAVLHGLDERDWPMTPSWCSRPTMDCRSPEPKEHSATGAWA